MLEPPPIYSLLGFREDLELTSEQITALDSIAQAVERRNAPVIAELRRVGESRSRRSRGAIVVNEQTRPLLEQVRDSNREAVRAVEELFTPEQEREVCRLFDLERRGSRREGEREERRDARRGPLPRMGAEADTTLFRQGPVWSWCAAGAS
jgi:hypothetical protein